MPNSWYQKTAQSLASMLLPFLWKIGHHSNNMTYWNPVNFSFELL